MDRLRSFNIRNDLNGGKEMFLKRLDIIGFKSFAERIGIDFVPGVTAVVGPNGSGKSNITDAIRWVLGEQSAKSLRGGKMEDIIFSGSDSRGALNFAEVTLTLQNEDQFLPIDYSEVSVTRRVYRTGESEFYINKQPCRLRDIVELFMDSGLGREAFSIISQGKVEQILNSKAEERRTIFEEAAGVLKYKNRKKQAETKLEETKDNLNRVNDIIFELEKQVEPLKEQASIAKEYVEKKESLEQIEVALTVVEIEQLHARWEALSKQLDEHVDQEVEMATTLQVKEAETTAIRERIATIDDTINSLQATLLATSEELEKLEGRKDVLKERKKNSAQNQEQLQTAVSDLIEKIDLLQHQKAELETKSAQLQKDHAILLTLLKENEDKLRLLSGNIEAELDSLKSDYIELLSKQANGNNELKYVQQQLKQLQTRMSHLSKGNEKYLEERQVINEQKQVVQAKIIENEQKIDEQIVRFRHEQQQLHSLQEQYKKQETKLYQAYQILQQAKSRKEILAEMEEDYAGFFQGVKQVLRAKKDQLKGIYGAVAELIQVPKKYETAIEIALGGAMQHIVVQDESHARSAIQYLKQHSYGRATFLPLTVLKERKISTTQLLAIENHPAFIGVADTLVQFDIKFQQVISNLLGTVIVTKDLQGANELAKLVQYRYRLVTLDGNVVHPGGSMTGGALKQKTTSLLSRKVELEQLKEKLVDMESQTAQLENEVKKLKASSTIQDELLESIRQKGEELRVQEQALKGELREIEMNEKNTNERLSLYDIETGQLKEEKDKFLQRSNELLNTLAHYEKEVKQLDEQIALLTSKKNSEHSSREQLVTENNDLKVRLKVMEESLHHHFERIKEFSTEIATNEERLEINRQDLQLLMQEIETSTTGETFLEEEATKKATEKDTTVQLIASKREERLRLHQQMEDIELETKELRRQQKGLVQIIKDEEVKLNRLDVELDNKLAHLREEYLLTFEGAKEQYQLTIPIEEARKQVKLIKIAIDELGVVNLGAIDEYERVSERYEFLLEQQTDLQTAMDTLFQAIDEMDDEMKKRFEETFTDIRFHFESVFQALFGGGRADLILSDPEDLLHTGVDIVAQPPGKKLQNLALLSGGERALTAIALLFSILKVRPVPFCVLDEVEAALDEANVQRFSEYLKQFSSETQFIVITHRKGTMEGADVLYGVTMQESGVSKLVSVRLEDMKEMA